MRENLTSGSMRGGWSRSSEVKAIYPPAGNRRRPLAGPPEPPRQPPTPPKRAARTVDDARIGLGDPSAAVNTAVSGRATIV